MLAHPGTNTLAADDAALLLTDDSPQAEAPPDDSPQAEAPPDDSPEAEAPPDDSPEADAPPKDEPFKGFNFTKDGGPGYAYKNEQEWKSAVGIKTLADLQFMTFPELKILVPGLLVEGCTLLAGRPKVGKSWMTLDIAIAVAMEGKCFGNKECKQGDVLYLALEDGERRLQKRVTKLLPTFNGTWPKELSYVTAWPRADAGGVAKIEAWLKEHPAARLVVVDVLARFRAATAPKLPAYEQDYNAFVGLQELATRRSVPIIVVHHTRKAAGEDAVDDISGTLGSSGAADAFIIIKNSASGKLMIGRGRDIEEFEHAVRFNLETCRWEILGAPKEVFASDNRKTIIEILKEAQEPLAPKDIRAAAGLTSDTVTNMLNRLAKDGIIEKVEHGKYKIVPPHKVDDMGADIF
jgi:AAA domain